MKNALKHAAIASAALIHSIAFAQDGPKATGTIDPLPRDLEIQLALSALPPNLRDDATVYVLDPAKGFEIARKGRGRFHTLVARTGDDTFRGSWPFTAYRDDILYPVSFNEEGARTHMRVFLDAARMQATGVAPDRLKKTIQERFKSGFYEAPKKAGVSYMLAPIQRTYVNPEVNGDVETISYPHVMYFAPGISNEDIGGELDGAGPFVIMPGHHGLMIHPRGELEAKAIVEQHARLLARLCEIKRVWCQPGAQRDP